MAIFFNTLSLTPQNTFACIPTGPVPWFKTKLLFDYSTLPNGIKIVQKGPTYEEYVLINKNPEPFYIVKENPTDWKNFPNSELPRNYEPLYKLTNNQSYYYFNDQYSKLPTAGYKLYSGEGNNSVEGGVTIDEKIYILEGESRQVYQDNRPAHVEIPESQSFKILGFYQGSPVEIRGMLMYSLNEDYDPQASAKGLEACKRR